MTRDSYRFDRFGNPEGRAFDLGGGDEDRVRGERILLYVTNQQHHIGPFAEQEMQALLATRGLRLDVRHAQTPGAGDLTAKLLKPYTQLWFISGDRPTLDDKKVRMIADWVRGGNGLAIWADNDPFFADANLLAESITGSRFTGNREADGVMVPGPRDTNGCFIEHQLTQGVNNLYEGITICTIEPGRHVSILGKSHDGQRCLGCFEHEGQRVVLDTGFTKLYSQLYERSAGLGRYLSNIGFWLARGSRGIDYEMLSPGRGEIASIKKGESKEYKFKVSESVAATCIVQWEGNARLGLSVLAPDGRVVARASSESSPQRVTVRTPTPGTYTCRVEGVDVPAAGMTYVARVALESAGRTGGTRGQAATPDQRRAVLPFYLLCDVSEAAMAHRPEFATALRKLQGGLARAPNTDDTVALSIITFDKEARTVAALAAPSVLKIPALALGSGRASYSAAIREYHKAFEQDRARLKSSGARVFRPCVFLLTHGAPGDRDYRNTFRSLLGYDPRTKLGNPGYPHVVAIGLPGATPESVAGLAYPDFGEPDRRGRWFVVDSPATALEGYRPVVQIIYRTITATLAAASEGRPLFTPPKSVPGTRSGIAGS